MAVERKMAGSVFKCDKLPAEDAIKLYMRMNEVFAGDQVVLATIASDPSRDNALKAFLHASMNNNLDGDKVTALLSEAVSLCRVGPDQCILGVNPQTLEDTVEVAWFALGAQFRDFLGAGLDNA